MSLEGFRQYPCPECGKGTVYPTKFQNYKTRIKGYPYAVPEAVVGVCDACGAKTFNARETQRWEKLFCSHLKEEHIFYTPAEIAELREILGLSMEDFAKLIGATRQSVHNWEKAGRTWQPSRMADLMMKLVAESHRSGSVDVISFLLEEAEKMGLTIQVRRSLVTP